MPRRQARWTGPASAATILVPAVRGRNSRSVTGRRSEPPPGLPATGESGNGTPAAHATGVPFSSCVSGSVHDYRIHQATSSMSYVQGGVTYEVCTPPHQSMPTVSLLTRASTSSALHHGFSPPGGVTPIVAADTSRIFTPSIHIRAKPSREPAEVLGRYDIVNRCHWPSATPSLKNGPTGCWPWQVVSVPAS